MKNSKPKQTDLLNKILALMIMSFISIGVGCYFDNGQLVILNTVSLLGLFNVYKYLSVYDK